MSTKEDGRTAAPGLRRVWLRRRNPLRTRSQRLHELFTVLVLLTVFALPALGFLVGRAHFHAAESHRAAVEGRAHPVTTVLRDDVPTTVWLDAAGNPTTAPPSPEAVFSDAAGMGVLTVLGGAGVLLVLYSVEYTVFMRSRMAAWARDWQRTAPLWTASR
ncbi:hypothetical protein [Yinghuangia seranimata]|uniref:hypothetical protein n=1 Tax=Yinghuangia seranimata TaxID=408067 RepID=UPI00248C2392|nr:hypothetical protein [Yinghuangia seranimata]MDI2125438.1 hypothetical protein [Yinghuangia seranimata]